MLVDLPPESHELRSGCALRVRFPAQLARDPPPPEGASSGRTDSPSVTDDVAVGREPTFP